MPVRFSRRRFLGLLAATAAARASDDPRFTNELWAAIEPVYAKTLVHPFLKGLADGSLAKARFEFYLKQDALYLRAFAQAVSIVSSKSPREEWMRILSQHAIDALKEKDSLHEGLLRGAAAQSMAPVNLAYTNHLLATALRGSFAEGLAALLPCYWIYFEVGKELKKRGSKDASYQRWIDAYADPAYGETVETVLRMMNREADRLDAAAKAKCKEAFLTSARYEYLFWDMAWREEQWLP